MSAITDLFIAGDATIRQALEQLDKTAEGHLMLVGEGNRLGRVITDGDLRRALLSGATTEDPISILPPKPPVTARAGAGVAEMLDLFRREKVAAIPRVDADGVPVLLERRETAGPILLSTPHMGEDEARFVQQAFDSNWIAPLGPEVEAFEAELADYVEVGHVAALSSGTAGLHLGLILLGVKDGDRVYCSSFTFAASANPIHYERGEPVFIDCEPGTWNMSPAALERALARDKAAGRLPRAIVVANLYGQSADMDALGELADNYGVPILEDAAESLGARYKGRMSGSFGRIGVFSFNGNKIITTSGGGALCSNDPEIVSRARFLATQAREAEVHYEHRAIGYNYRLSNVLAAIGRGQLRVIQERIARRRAIYEMYRASLCDLQEICWMPEPQGYFSTRWLSAMTLDRESPVAASRVLEALRATGIEARPLWKPMHRQPVFHDCEYYPHTETQSVSDSLFAQGLCLPSGSNLPDAAIARVAEQVRLQLST